MGTQNDRTYWWNAAAAAGGVVLGVLGRRLLPPLVAMANGAMRVKLGDDPFRKLENDHRLIEATLSEMWEAADQSPAARMKPLLVLKRKLGKHAMAEEDVVYPILYEVAGATEKSNELYLEHAQMKIHLYALEDAVQSEPTWRSRVRTLRELIGDHIRDEEDREFPRLRTMLEESRHAKLAAKIQREEALVL